MCIFEDKAESYKEGWKAFFDGIILSKNPYSDESRETEEWGDGWLEAFDNNEAHQPE